MPVNVDMNNKFPEGPDEEISRRPPPSFNARDFELEELPEETAPAPGTGHVMTPEEQRAWELRGKLAKHSREADEIMRRALAIKPNPFTMERVRKEWKAPWFDAVLWTIGILAPVLWGFGVISGVAAVIFSVLGGLWLLAVGLLIFIGYRGLFVLPPAVTLLPVLALGIFCGSAGRWPAFIIALPEVLLTLYSFAIPAEAWRNLLTFLELIIWGFLAVISAGGLMMFA